MSTLRDGNNLVKVTIDESEGFDFSFLEKAFGSLVCKHNFTIQDLAKRLKIKYQKPEFKMYETSIWNHIRNAKPEKEPA